MKQEALPGAEKYTKARRWKKRWYRVMVCLAGVVVFCTVYAMILPAVTLASNPLDGDYAYVTDFSVTAITDGTAPFDGDNNAGNDEKEDNKIVRTFDTVTYTINVAYESYTGSAFTDARVRLEFVLPVGKSQAEFDLAAMAWLENYTLTEDTSGGTTRQVLTGYKHLFNNDNREVVPGNFSNNVIVNIKMMKNEEKIQPIFYAAMEHNEWDKEFCEEHRNHEVTHGQEKKKAIPDEITVSAAPKYNVQIKRAAATEASMTYDFSEYSSQLYDADKALNTDDGERQGRIFVMGVTLQLYNDTKAKQLRGIEIPKGEIKFDIKLKSEFVPRYHAQYGEATVVTEDYTPKVWSYGPQDLGWNPDRKTDMTSYDFAFGNAAPWNKYDESKDRDISCYDGGEWTAVQVGDTVHFTVENYKFDGVFPCANASQSAADSIYYNKQSGIENIGCFSAVELYIVQPYTTESGTDVRDDFSTGGKYSQTHGTECIDGAFYMTVKDVSLQSTSVSGQKLAPALESNSNQGAKDDDEITFQADLKRDGTYEQHNLYSSRDVCNIVDIFGNWGNQPGNCTQNGDDWAVIGTKFRLTFGGYAQTNGDDANKMCAAKWLLKFDPTAIELEPETDTLGVDNYYSYRFLYAVKPDGTGWENDAELKTTSMLRLEYYESIEDAKNDGKTIVGILVEAKPKTNVEDIPPGILQTYFSQNAKVKEDISLENERFIITEESMIWTVDKYREAITNGGIPSLFNNNPSDLTTTTELPESTDYIKPEYGNGGGEYNRHTGTYDEGDTLLVLSCKPTIFKNVEQTLPNSTDEKISYDLDAGQRAIDFVLTPKVECETSTQTLGKKVTVTIVDKLPNYLTYSPGSCYFGGTYNPTSVNGGTKGEITGGKQIEPVVVPNADGTQTLTWTITDVPVGQNMDVIHYSVNVVTTGDKDKDVPVGPTNLTNTAEITVEGSEQPHSVAYGNVAEKGILLIRGSASAYGKYSKNTVVEPDGEINYVIFYANNSETAISDIVLLDTMPRDEYLGNDFTGSYTVTSWKLNVDKCTPSNFKLYYTTNVDYAGKTFIADGATGDGITKAQIKTWETATIGVDGSVTDMNGKMPVAWALIGTLSANEGAYVDLTIKLNPEFTETNNVYRNTFSNSENETVTTTEEHSVIRTLEGLTWMDDNADGVQDSNEAKLSEVNVSLWKLGEGTKFTTTTDGYLNAAIDFKEEMFRGLNASDLKQIRIVASGIPAGQQPQLFYATNNDDHIWYRAKKLLSRTTAETEYVYETQYFDVNDGKNYYIWEGPINKLRWDPFYLPNQSFTLKSITFDLTDGTTREFDFTAKGAYETYLHLYYFNFVRYGDPAYEADYYPYCYPGTNQQVSVETGKQISVLAQSAAEDYEPGRYKFTYLPAGFFAVKFQDGTTQKISNYIASPANRDGVNDALDSDGIATYSSDRSQLLKTVITGIEMPKAEDMKVVHLESTNHDSGFYERGYELPKSGGTGAEIYTAGGFLMFTSAAFVLLNKHFRRRKL